MTGQTTEEKNVFEINKQMTTLSAGAAVLIATFMKDIFPETDSGALDLVQGAKVAIFLAFGAFFGSTIFSVVGLLPYITRFNRVSTVLGVSLFLLGILIFVFVVYFSLNIPEVTLENPDAAEPVAPSP